MVLMTYYTQEKKFCFLERNYLAFIKMQWGLMFELCFDFVLSALLVMLITDLSLGLINRYAQQLNIFFLPCLLKALSHFLYC
nr:flagellar biosynthetic protein FliR [Candidatus Hamiltonella defensa]